jgi:hypothetical protein
MVVGDRWPLLQENHQQRLMDGSEKQATTEEWTRASEIEE